MGSAERRTATEDLTRRLELRWRTLLLAEAAVSALALGLTLSLLVLALDIVLRTGTALGMVLLAVNGSCLAAALVVAGLRRREPVLFLVDADKAYGLKSLLASAYSFAERERAGSSELERGFRRLVINRGATAARDVNAREVYPAQTPRRSGLLAGLAVALGVLLVLNASGWFDRPAPPYLEEAFALEDAGRRLAERAGDNRELQELAEELMRLGEDAQQGGLNPDEVRRRIEELSDRVESQVGNLGRTPPLSFDEEAQVPPEAAESIRSALESGMTGGEVAELFTRMRSEGNTVPDMIQALEEASPDRAPDSNLAVDQDEVRELLDQLNTAPPEPDEVESDIVNELTESQQVLQQMGSGLAELTEGADDQAGSAAESGIGAGGQGEVPESAPPQDGSGQDALGGELGGTREVDDTFDDDFARPEETSPILREIQGVVTDNTILDILIRELPAEATSELTEEDRDVLYDRIVEEAVNREQTPAELQQLVRNYFLRLTLAHEEGRNE